MLALRRFNRGAGDEVPWQVQAGDRGYQKEGKFKVFATVSTRHPSLFFERTVFVQTSTQQRSFGKKAQRN